jgi:hypothetical protein
MSEDELVTSVCDLAATVGLRVAHFRPARTNRGWRTPLQGNGGAGFPDTVIWGPGGLLLRELKQDRAYPSQVQRQRADELRAAGADVGVWKPRDWHSGRIHDELRAISRYADRGKRV